MNRADETREIADDLNALQDFPSETDAQSADHTPPLNTGGTRTAIEYDTRAAVAWTRRGFDRARVGAYSHHATARSRRKQITVDPLWQTARRALLRTVAGGRRSVAGGLAIPALRPPRPGAWVSLRLRRLPRRDAAFFAGGVMLGVLAAQLLGVEQPTRNSQPASIVTPGTSPTIAASPSPDPLPVPASAEPSVEPVAAPDSSPPINRTRAEVAAPSYRGVLGIDSQPAGASVFINNQRVGETPIVLSSLPAGSRAVRLQLNGYAPWSRSVQVVANQRATVTAQLEPAR